MMENFSDENDIRMLCALFIKMDETVCIKLRLRQRNNHVDETYVACS